MNHHLNLGTLSTLGARVAVLSVGRYALPVRIRMTGTAVDCRVPTWSDVGDLLDPSRDVTLVAYVETGPYLRWWFVRGTGVAVAAPDWAGLEPPGNGGFAPDDLYQVVRITPKRIEWMDEQRGWGARETSDL